MMIRLLLLCVLVTAVQATAQTYPSRPLRIVTPVVSGSAPDLRMRQLAPKLAEALGQAVIVENRPGGNGVIGAREAARAAPDGHTLFNANVNNAINDALNPDPATRLTYELVAITDIAQSPLVMVVHPSVPVKTVSEYVEYARANPRALNYGSSGSGSMIQLLGERLKRATQIDVLEVPYKSPGAEIPDLLAGNIRSGYSVYLSLGPHIASGKLRALAVAGPRRLSVLPDIPTLGEAGFPGMEATTWNGLFVPAGTPASTVQTLHRAIAAALNAPDLRDPVIASGSELGGMPPERFTAFVRDEVAKWGKVIAEAGIRLR